MKSNYLNNKDILSEIHKSKASYCSFKSPEDHQYDLIIKNVSQINTKNIRLAKQARAERLAKEAYDSAIKRGESVKLDQFKIPTRRIPETDVVFRVMTWEHIPPAAPKVAIDEDSDDTEYDTNEVVPVKYTKVNFPPFMHYKVDKNGKPVCVGKSHWQGDLKKGQFSKDHGTITNKLATMFIKLCERYATRGNWRGYSYNDEMKSQALLQLAQIGLQFDEMKSANPFAYYTTTISNSFTRVLNIEKNNQKVRDDILELNNYNPSYTRQMEWHNSSDE